MRMWNERFYSIIKQINIILVIIMPNNLYNLSIHVLNNTLTIHKLN